MKSQKKDLDIDLIGEKDPLTKVEEKQLSDFFKNRKLSANIIFQAKKTKILNKDSV